ncbi:MAG: Hexaprenyldihydroxybenzoate methyltransferase, mitochondrial [Cirrosporium novae-zelandiae]|nr:MAG: Hexaprenyldihydroxybenzoate methyltransferase, mitochondrial [Cirrosporium novae-zelandiae]
MPPFRPPLPGRPNNNRTLLTLTPLNILSRSYYHRALPRQAIQHRFNFTTTTTRTTSSSVNPSEISHFDALASEWWNPYGSSRLLHLMNPLRHDFINACLLSSQPSPSKNLRFLDIGCGGGIFAESAARRPEVISVTAIDPSSEVLAVAKAHARQDPLFTLQQPEKLEYLNKSIEELEVPKSPEEQYDILSLFEVIEHVDRPATFLKSCMPFVKPGGWIVMSTMARTWTSWFTTKVMAEDVLRIVPRGTHEWSKYINEKELREFFEKQKQEGAWGSFRAMGVIYVPGFGWREVEGGERWGNYFFAARKDSISPPPS